MFEDPKICVIGRLMNSAQLVLYSIVSDRDAAWDLVDNMDRRGMFEDCQVWGVEYMYGDELTESIENGRLRQSPIFPVKRQYSDQ